MIDFTYDHAHNPMIESVLMTRHERCTIAARIYAGNMRYLLDEAKENQDIYIF